MSARKILLATQTISTMTVGLLGPIWAIYVEKIGGDILATANTYAVFTLVYGFLMILLGKFTDRVKETEYFIIAGFFLSALGFLGYLLVRNPTQLFLNQAVLGIALAIMTPAHDSLYTKHMDHGRFAYEWGQWEGIYYISEGVAAVIGGLVVVWIGFNALFILMASLSFLAGLYILLLPRKVL